MRFATCIGITPRDWAVGDGSGEAVEIFTSCRMHAAGLSVDGGVTLAKILYFFDHEGNKQTGHPHEQGPIMEYVLVYEYVTRGKGRSKLGDHATEHPTYTSFKLAHGQSPLCFSWGQSDDMSTCFTCVR